MTVNIVDDDSPGVFLLANAVSVGEDGTTGSYDLEADQPACRRRGHRHPGRRTGNAGYWPDVTFTAENWAQTQRVTVAAVDDAIAEAEGNGLLRAHGWQ